MSRSFSFCMEGRWELPVEAVWPDGDAPDDPTVEDVLEVVNASLSLRMLISEWNLYPVLTVDGVEAALS